MTETSEDPTLALLDMLDDVEQENAETSREQEQQVTQIPLSPEEEGATGEPLLLPATTPPVNLKPILAKENQHIAKRKQLKSALAHFNNFLKQYWALETSTRDLSTIPNHDRLYDFLQDGDLNPELLGSFCTYLSAADSPTSRDGHLSASTCGNYLSTISSYYIDRQYLPNWYYYEKEGDELSPAKLSACFGKESDYYSKSTKALKKKISDRSKENGIPMVVPKAGASEEDWIIIAMSCVLQGRTHPHLPEFWAFSVALTHFAARGNECAFLQHKQGTTAEVPGTNNQKNVTGIFEVNNFKQAGTSQEMHVFPHISGWYRDFYFAMAYSFALQNEKSNFLFPRFHQEASKTTKEGDNDSTGVSNVWKRQLDLVTNHVEEAYLIFKELVEKELLKDDPRFTVGLCSHSPKKYAIRTMAMDLTALFIIFRAGWKIDNAHTLFDYLTRNGIYDIKAGKVCAGWTAKLDGEIFGGYNNIVSDLDREDHELFRSFTQHLFWAQSEMMDPGLRDLYGLSVLRFYGDFCDFLEAANYKHKMDGISHPFVQKVEESMAEAIHAVHKRGATNNEVNAILKRWQEQVQMGFKRRNFYGMLLKEVPEMMVDGRTILQQMDLLQAWSRNVADAIGKFEDRLAQIESTQQVTLRMLASIQDLIMKQKVLGDETNVSSDGNLDPSDHAYPVPFCGLPRTESKFDPTKYKGASCHCVFRLWFRDQIPVKYYNLMQGGAAGKTARNSFCIIKKTVHAMLKELDEYPHPEQDLDELAAIAIGRMQKTLKMPAEEIKYKRIGTTWMKTEDKKRVTKQSLFDEGGYAEKDFPSGTPPGVIKFFDNIGGKPNAGRKRAREEE